MESLLSYHEIPWCVNRFELVRRSYQQKWYPLHNDGITNFFHTVLKWVSSPGLSVLLGMHIVTAWWHHGGYGGVMAALKPVFFYFWTSILHSRLRKISKNGAKDQKGRPIIMKNHQHQWNHNPHYQFLSFNQIFFAFNKILPWKSLRTA